MDKLQRAVDGQLSALALSKINMSEEEVERTLRGMERNPVHDNVNHPSHYETGNFECIDVMVETQGEEATINFCVCNALKYIYRHKRKNGIEDIQKAIWYLNKAVELDGRLNPPVERKD